MADLRSILIDIRNSTFTNDELNLIIEAVKHARAQNGRRVARTLRIGEQVQFTGKTGPVVGRLEQIKIKKAIVVSGMTRWNVPLAMLEAI
jgi:hypothetical protein